MPWTIRHAVLWLGKSSRALPSPGPQPRTPSGRHMVSPTQGRQGPQERSVGLVRGQSALPWLQVQLKEASGNRHGARHLAPEPCTWKLTLYLENRQRRT